MTERALFLEMVDQIFNLDFDLKISDFLLEIANNIKKDSTDEDIINILIDYQATNYNDKINLL